MFFFIVFIHFVLFLCFFFFFKQKTAYEMRISDWSSDVCSSDLRQAETHPVIIIAEFERAEARANLGGLAREEAVPVLAERGVEARGDVDPPDPTVGAVAQIADVILAPAQIPQTSRPPREAIEVDLNIVLFAVHIIGHPDLTGQPADREILAIEIAEEPEVVARGMGVVLEAGLGVLFAPP